MEINALKVFLAVVDSGSFSKASEHLGYTPAGISYIINNLEEDLGIKLIDRDYNGVKPNSNGMALLQDIRRVIDSYDSLRIASTHERPAAMPHCILPRSRQCPSPICHRRPLPFKRNVLM